MIKLSGQAGALWLAYSICLVLLTLALKSVWDNDLKRWWEVWLYLVGAVALSIKQAATKIAIHSLQLWQKIRRKWRS